MMKTQRDLLNFILRYKGKWHSFNDDAKTIEAACGLHNLGLARVNEFNQITVRESAAIRYIAQGANR